MCNDGNMDDTNLDPCTFDADDHHSKFSEWTVGIGEYCPDYIITKKRCFYRIKGKVEHKMSYSPTK